MRAGSSKGVPFGEPALDWNRHGSQLETVTIDGSEGEGGGQILRSALALSLVTRKPFCIEKIRAGRKKPGLLRQHLTAVRAAAEIGSAQADGAELGSAALTFTPGDVVPGEYRFAVGTAGSAMLVLQTILPALWTADGPSTIVVEGGTHNPFAPPYEFVERAFLPVIRRMGPAVETTLERRGFYPAGGGRVVVRVTPAKSLARVDLVERGEIRSRRATAILSSLPRSIGVRKLEVLGKKLGWDEGVLQIDEDRTSVGPGNALVAEIETDGIAEIFVGFGEKGTPAEVVANRLVDEIREWLAAGVPVGTHLADQLILPFALAGGGEFSTVALSRHSRTNMEIVRRFLDVTCEVETTGRTSRVRIASRPKG